MKKKEKIQRLDTKVKLNGFNYELFRRSENVCAYKQYDKKTGQHVATEVFKVRIRQAEVIGGADYPIREVYPSESDWGMSAWSLPVWRDDEFIQNRIDKLQKEIDDDRLRV